MIDFIRIRLPLSENLKNGIDRFQIVALDSGELQKKPFGYEGNLKFNETNKAMFLSGSLHSYFNDHVLHNDRANRNDFSYHSLISCIDILAEKLNVDWEHSKLTQLEFGFNLAVNRPIREIIDSIKLHKELEPTTNYDTAKRNSKFFHRDQYWIKVYDKSRQYLSPEDKILRLEKKFYSPQLKKLGIRNLNDLKDKQKLNALYQSFLKEFDKLLVIDSYTPEGLSHKEHLKLAMRSVGSYWKGLRRKRSRPTVNNHYKDLNSLIANYGLDSTKTELRRMIADKYKELIEVEKSLHFQAI